MSEHSAVFNHLVGTVLADKYRINALLGVGGMGAVFDGEHILMRKRVAIKLLLPDVSQTGEVVARFEREAMAAANIDHPNVVKATDFGKLSDGSFYLVLEFVEGQNLRHLLARGRLSPERALGIIEQVASVLVKAHALGIVHRDLKPENIMLVRREDAEGDFVKVLDFGIAKVPVEALTGQEVQTSQGLTRMGVMYGTPEYMAPEQAMGTGIDHRADLYALGVMLFELVTGTRPFDSENVISLVTMHIVEPPPALSERLPPGTPLPEGLERLVFDLLEKDREKRVQSARELVDRIRSLLGGSPMPSQVGASSAWSQGGPISAGSPSVGVIPAGAVPALTSMETAQASSLPIGYVPTAQVGAMEPTAHAIGSVVPSTAGESRWRREIQAVISGLERLRSYLPGPLSRLPLATFPMALGALLVLIVVMVAWPRGAPAEKVVGAATSASPGGPTQAQIEDARAAGPAALEALAERYPKDQRVTRALLQAYHEGKRHVDALRMLAKLAETEQKLLSEDLPLAVLKGALEGPTEAMDAAFTLLESRLGSEGVEILYSLWTADKKDVSEKVRSRAGKSLVKPEVKELAFKSTRVLIELKTSAASCEARRMTIALALEAGDARAVPLLQPFTSKRGCGFLGRVDCWPCLRNSNLLNDAIQAAAKRPAP
ncbi:MAG: serine/threonine-protein kinase [Myxococcales bacterium]|nr:serine/threonine protein kinase [Polyangiaceae bacterium]MDW8248500.1 serine/threonine-protein kinase [Myxococcales bacterium]